VTGGSPGIAVILADTLHSVDPVHGVVHDAALAIRGDRIADVGARQDILGRFAGADVVDARPCMLVPGLVDVHHHPGLFFFSRLRGRGDPPVPGLLARGGRIEAFLSHLSDGIALTPEETEASAAASLLRGLKAGTTFFNDGAGGDVEGLVRAAASLRLRGIVTYGFGADLTFARPPSPGGGAPELHPTIDPAELMRKAGHALAIVDRQEGLQGWHNVLCDLTCSDELYRLVTAACREQGRGINTHTSTVRNHEAASLRLFGKTSVRRLLDLQAIGPHWIGAHMGFLRPEEVRDLAAAGGHVAHCPGTSMGAGKGILHEGRIPAMRAAGVNVALGTDSAQWADIVGQMALAFYGHKEALADDTVMTPEEVLRMATLDAARACGRDGELGSLTPGKRADFVLVSTADVRLASLPDPLFAWMRCGHSGDIAGVWLGGERRVWRGEVLGVDEQQVVRRALDAARGFLERSGR
jgi:5-methylthioadenosine/S-adenosylhomocysteine deaminase